MLGYLRIGLGGLCQPWPIKVLLPLGVLMSVAALACGSSEPASPSPVSTPTSSSNPTTCFSFSPARAEPPSNNQRVTVQVVTRTASCSWTATSADSWITIVRTGSLYQTGDGILTFDVDGNMDERFGGCPTTARTGHVTVAEESTRLEARLQVIQQGSPGPYRPPVACTVTALPYGVTMNGSLVASDCVTAGSARTKYYTFQGLSDQRIDISMLGGRTVPGGLQVPLMRLYGPGGGFVVSAGGNVVIDNPTISRRLSCGGTFTLEVSSVTSSTFNPTGLGNYSIRLTSQN